MTARPTLPRWLYGAQPRFHRGNDVGCLIVHGFMASPAEVGWLGEDLAQAGYTVYVPRLTGHGIHPDDMKRMRWRDWYAHVLDSYHILRQQCERVYVIGHSMGALLVTMLASEYTVAGTVITAAPFTARNALMPYAHWLKFVLPYTRHPTTGALQAEILEEQNRRGEFNSGRVHYAKWVSGAVAELYQMIEIGRACIPAVTGDVLLLYARQDDAVNLSDVELFKQNAPDAHVQSHVLARGGHIIYQDVAREEAFGIVRGFIASCEDQNAHES